MKKDVKKTPIVKPYRYSGEEIGHHEWAFAGMKCTGQRYDFYFRCNCHGLTIGKVITGEMCDLMLAQGTEKVKP